MSFIKGNFFFLYLAISAPLILVSSCSNASQPASVQDFPYELILQEDFESRTSRGWQGDRSSVSVVEKGNQEGGYCLKVEDARLLKNPKYLPVDKFISFQDDKTHLKFDFYPHGLKGMIINMGVKGEGNYHVDSLAIKPDEWNTVDLAIENFRPRDKKSGKVAKNNTFYRITIAGIKEESKNPYLLIDNVVLYNKIENIEHVKESITEKIKVLQQELSSAEIPKKEAVKLKQNLEEIMDKQAGLDKIEENEIRKLHKDIEKEYEKIEDSAYHKKMVEEFGESDPKFAVALEGPIKKIFLREEYSQKIKKEIQICAARGEYENFQLILKPLFEEELKDVRIECTDLWSNDNDYIIENKNVKWYMEGYVKVKPSAVGIHTGWVPDPLLEVPFFNVAKGEIQPVWMNVFVPEGTKAGDYEGRISIKAHSTSGEKVWIMLNLKVSVWDFELPTPGNFKTAFYFSEHHLKKFYKNNISNDIRRKYYKFMLDHRINPAGLYHDWPFPEEDNIGYCIENGMNFITIGALDPSKTGWINNFIQFLKEKKESSIAALYITDEPGPDKWGKIAEYGKNMHEMFPGSKTFGAVAPHKELMESIDIFVPVVGDYGPNTYKPEDCREARRIGKETWLYVCADPLPPYPNFMIDNEAIDPRILFWLCWKGGHTGFLYYYINKWDNNHTGIPLKGPRVESWDTYTYKDLNGDGQLMYPGANMVPLSSYRLENIRDGIEDWEYFYLLKEKIEKLKQQGSNAALISRLEKLLEIEDDIINETGSRYTRNPDILYERRRALGQGIEEANEKLLNGAY